MAIRVVCDGGCGASTDDKAAFEEIGIAKVCQYCPECAPGIKKMYQAIDALHDKTANMFKNGLERIRKAARKDMPNAELPDV